MEACASAHYWGRELEALGHQVRLIPPIHVKPFVKRQKNDANDAGAIVEAAARPTMRFVPVKTAEQQSRAMVFKTRDLLVRQRDQIANALRGHLMAYGIVAPAGLTFVKSPVHQIDDSDLPPLVIELARLHLDRFQTCSERIAVIERRLRDEARSDPETVRLQTDSPGYRTNQRDGDQGFRSAYAGLQAGARLRSLARPRTRPTVDGRQAAPRANLEDGPARYQTPADHRRDDPHPVGLEERPAGGLLARTHARAQAAHAGGDRARQ